MIAQVGFRNIPNLQGMGQLNGAISNFYRERAFPSLQKCQFCFSVDDDRNHRVWSPCLCVSCVAWFCRLRYQLLDFNFGALANCVSFDLFTFLDEARKTAGLVTCSSESRSQARIS